MYFQIWESTIGFPHAQFLNGKHPYTPEQLLAIFPLNAKIIEPRIPPIYLRGENAPESDFISVVGLPDNHLVVSSRVADLFQKHKHIGIQFLPITVSGKEGASYTFVLLHPFLLLPELVDFSKTEIRLPTQYGLGKRLECEDYAAFSKHRRLYTENPPVLYKPAIAKQAPDLFCIPDAYGGKGFIASVHLAHQLQQFSGVDLVKL